MQEEWHDQKDQDEWHEIKFGVAKCKVKNLKSLTEHFARYLITRKLLKYLSQVSIDDELLA